MIAPGLRLEVADRPVIPEQISLDGKAALLDPFQMYADVSALVAVKLRLFVMMIETFAQVPSLPDIENIVQVVLLAPQNYINPAQGAKELPPGIDIEGEFATRCPSCCNRVHLCHSETPFAFMASLTGDAGSSMLSMPTQRLELAQAQPAR
jgi:hypothetical protein